MTRLGSLAYLLFLALAPGGSRTHAAIFNFHGVGDWSDPNGGWSGNNVPSAEDEVWMNTADASVTVLVDCTAEIDKLIVGRHALNTELIVDGGTVLVGSGNNDVLFVGQYEDASGTFVLNSGRVEVQGELAVAVSGGGNWIQHGGSTYVRDRFVIGRYNKPEAVGHVILEAGSIVADRFDMNSNSKFELKGGILALNGNHVNKVQGHIDANRIIGTTITPVPKVRYDAVSDRTYVWANTDRGFNNYYGQKSSTRRRRGMLRRRYLTISTATHTVPSFFDPALWNPDGLPGPGSEAWMNTDDTAARIDNNEVATAEKLIVGRHRKVEFVIEEGGELVIGDDDSTSAILFLGQYATSNANMVLKDNGRIKVNGEFAVSVSGPGSFHQRGGTVEVTGRFVVGRYNKIEAVGTVRMQGGSIRADRMDVNDYSEIDLTNGFISLRGDVRTKMADYVNDGKIRSHGTDSVVIEYDASEDRTTLHPHKYIKSEDWDVTGILLMNHTKIGPRLPEVDRTTMTVRQFTPAPEYGVHPRIFFGPEEIPAIRASLETTTVGQAARDYAKQMISLLAYGRNSCGGKCYNDIPLADRKQPNGKDKISNPGLFHTNPSYTDLIAGNCETVMGQTGTHRNVLGGGMAIEAFELLIFPEQDDAASRQAGLAAAMSTWADCALAEPNFAADGTHGTAAARDLFGGQHLAFAYDFAYNFMSADQRAKVRKAIATMLWKPEQFTGITTEGYATTTNWVTINSFVPMMLLAIEGETTESADGWSTEALEAYFEDLMMANYKFLTYGYYKEGAGYEGAGKNYQYNACMVAYAKRGYNFFTHPNVQAYGKRFLPALLQPYGNYITTYDTIGGSGKVNNQNPNADWGGQQYHANDVIGLKWAYPDDPSIDFMYGQFMETPYRGTDSSKQTFLDLYDQKITPRSTYNNNFLMLMMMPSDYATGDFETLSATAYGSHTFNGKERGLVITRSSFSEDALAMNFHVRQDMGGHTYGDRNSFTLSGLGRLWVRNPVGYVPETEWSSGILVDGTGITISPQDGRKARMPSRIAAHQDEPLATFTMGDATYAYNNAWKWCTTCRPVGSDGGIGGWDPVLETWNDFRHPANQISDFYGDVPFVDYANWRYGGYTEAIHKQKVNDLSQVYRQAGLVRGDYPYALIVDDLHKISEDTTPEWQWLSQLPADLSLLSSTQYSSIDSNLDASVDLVFQEPAATGNRKLLVRILNAEGDQPAGLGTFAEHLNQNLSDDSRSAWRLTITRVASRPRFRVMLYPFQDGQPVPKYTVAADGAVQLEFASNAVDTIRFHTTTPLVGGLAVEMTGIEITRSGGVNVIDTRNQAVPMDIRW